MPLRYPSGDVEAEGWIQKWGAQKKHIWWAGGINWRTLVVAYKHF